MSRELKRVPLDFNWPTGRIWIGYINPFSYTQCPACDGSGYNPQTKKLSDDWYTHNRMDGEEGWQYHLEQDEVDALVEGNRLYDLTDGKSDGYIPSVEEVNARAQTDFCLHDALSHWICLEVRATRLGFYGKCELCEGTGELWFSPEIKTMSEEWEQRDPPEGNGYQLWEDCSEGSPVSPVFESLDGLCEWASKNATTFASFKASAEEWRKMLDDDFVHHQEGNVTFM